MDKDNTRAFRYWNICNRHSRPIGMNGVQSLPVSEVLDLLRAHDESQDIFKKVMLIEHHLLPVIRENSESKNAGT